MTCGIMEVKPEIPANIGQTKYSNFLSFQSGYVGSIMQTLSDCFDIFFIITTETTPNSPISVPKSPTFPSGRGPWSDECSICYENMVDTVIYACGHMCLCYTCGLKLKKMSNACCPICRRQIKDIIKTYRST